MPADSAQSRGAALFDQTPSSAHGRRRRPAPDWGGDDLFDHVPRRRFARTVEEPRDLALEAPPAAVAAVDLAPAPARPAPVQELVLARRAEYAPVPIPPGGRRTVTVTGRPGHGVAPRTHRPGRTVEQRIGARPERLAAWAFALGLLLIVLAVATSG
jgi:hypothetical protein